MSLLMPLPLGDKQSQHAATSPAIAGDASPGLERAADDCPDGGPLDGNAGRGAASVEQIRTLVRLVQCPLCSFPLTDPVTLPCGRTLCRRCLPPPHPRSHISYPAIASRLQGFHCPFEDCVTEHAAEDCGLDVTLSCVVAAVRAECEKGCKAALARGSFTHLRTRDEWEVAGIPSLKSPDHEPRAFPGGRLLATYLIADAGDLDYNAQVTYALPPTRDHADADAAIWSRVKELTLAEIDCQVCYALFYDAVTTPCGHTFCRLCLQRVLDNASYCPICRRHLTIQPVAHRAASPPNQVLENVVAVFCADMLEHRRQMIESEGLLLRASPLAADDLGTPIFTCTLSFPSMPTFIHVFEPRYRLLVRRALDGPRTFGMVAPHGPSGGLADLGTLLRIARVEFFPDGRSLLEAVGVSRFRILRRGARDGYTVAQTQPISDVGVAEEEALEAAETAAGSGSDTDTVTVTGSGSGSGSGRAVTAAADLDALPTRALMRFASDFVRSMRAESVGWLTARILAVYGDCPDDPAVFPWWFANILPVRDAEKYRLLGTTSVRERLKICCGWILEWESRRWSLLDCLVM